MVCRLAPYLLGNICLVNLELVEWFLIMPNCLIYCLCVSFAVVSCVAAPRDA